jgi:hypothetical protein
MSPAVYTVSFEKSGYVTQTASVTLAYNSTVTQNASLASAPPPTANVSLVVLDPHNAPVSNATVTVTYANGAPSVIGTTNAFGQVNFTNQPAGITATISVTHPYGNGTSTLTFSPGTYASAVHISPIYTRLRVSVIAGDGSGPLVGAMVTVGYYSAQTDSSGEAVFESIPVGFVAVNAMSQDGSKSGVDHFTLVGIEDSVAIQVF